MTRRWLALTAAGMLAACGKAADPGAEATAADTSAAAAKAVADTDAAMREAAAAAPRKIPVDPPVLPAEQTGGGAG
ncbi:MAG: hypothetical protein ACRYG4_12650 [Janthinobacterium lividum]